MIAHLASPLPVSAYLPQQDGGGVAGEIFRSDITGDGTVGLEPNVSVFNAFNFANFGGAGNQLSGALNGAPGTSLNNAGSAPPKIKLKIESLSTL